MAVTIYNAGLDLVGQWEGGLITALLLNDAGYVPDPDHNFVNDLVPGTNEIAGAGYNRQSLIATRTVDDANDRITYDAAVLDFGNIVAGETVEAMVLYLVVNDDTDSILIAYFPVTPTATSGTAFTVTPDAIGFLYADQGA